MMLSDTIRNTILCIQDKHKPIEWTYFYTTEDSMDIEYFIVNFSHRKDMYLEFRIWGEEPVMIHCNKFLSQRKIAGIETGVQFENDVLKTVKEFIYFGIGGVQ